MKWLDYFYIYILLVFHSLAGHISLIGVIWPLPAVDGPTLLSTCPFPHSVPHLSTGLYFWFIIKYILYLHCSHDHKMWSLQYFSVLLVLMYCCTSQFCIFLGGSEAVLAAQHKINMTNLTVWLWLHCKCEFVWELTDPTAEHDTTGVTETSHAALMQLLACQSSNLSIASSAFCGFATVCWV